MKINSENSKNVSRNYTIEILVLNLLFSKIIIIKNSLNRNTDSWGVNKIYKKKQLVNN